MKVQTLACPICTHWLSSLPSLHYIVWISSDKNDTRDRGTAYRRQSCSLGTGSGGGVLFSPSPYFTITSLIYLVFWWFIQIPFPNWKWRWNTEHVKYRKWLRAQNLQSNWFACEWLPLSSCGILDSLSLSFFTMKWTQWELASKLVWGFNEIIHVTPPNKRSHS